MSYFDDKLYFLRPSIKLLRVHCAVIASLLCKMCAPTGVDTITCGTRNALKLLNFAWESLSWVPWRCNIHFIPMIMHMIDYFFAYERALPIYSGLFYWNEDNNMVVTDFNRICYTIIHGKFASAIIPWWWRTYTWNNLLYCIIIFVIFEHRASPLKQLP